MKMRWNVVVLLMVFGVENCLGFVPTICDSGWTTFNGRCYLSTSGDNFQLQNEAQTYCESLNSNLVSIHSTEENSFVIGLNGCSANGEKCWIGYTRVSGTTYTWLDGTTASFENWGRSPTKDFATISSGTGTWEDTDRGNNAAVCVTPAKCPAGYFLSTAYSTVPYGLPDCAPCPAGKYREEIGATSESGCLNCPAGRFGSIEGETSPNCAGSCPQGYFCSEGTFQGGETPCPAGKYGALSGLISESQCLPCSAGYYCNPGSVSAMQFPCRAGTCGYMQQSTEDCSRSCPAGYYCPVGSICPDLLGPEDSGPAFECGSNTVYCAGGNSAPVAIRDGRYSSGGTETTRSQEISCEKGYYCISGIRFPCPAGKYGDLLAQTGAASCKSCHAGDDGWVSNGNI